MNDKDFFAQLAGGATEPEGEFEPQLTKAGAVPLATEKVSALDDFVFDDAEGHLTIDVYQNADAIVIESAIAGVKDDDLDVAITPESVTIKGKRERKESVKKGDYLHQECFWGRFSRSVILPQEIDPDKAQATLKDGVLKIVLPKIHRSKSKKVKVKLD